MFDSGCHVLISLSREELQQQFPKQQQHLLGDQSNEITLQLSNLWRIAATPAPPTIDSPPHCLLVQSWTLIIPQDYTKHSKSKIIH